MAAGTNPSPIESVDLNYANHDQISYKEPVDACIVIMRLLADQQRLEVMGHFCKSCGAADPRCQCWNDE